MDSRAPGDEAGPRDDATTGMRAERLPVRLKAGHYRNETHAPRALSAFPDLPGLHASPADLPRHPPYPPYGLAPVSGVIAEPIARLNAGTSRSIRFL